ncbi:MAG: hypothetical protein ACP5XB_31525, partial [Isosphaeraceae bacterium]
SGLVSKIKKYASRIEIEMRIAAAYSRAAATAGIRSVDPTNPTSWEFAGFSQHGEDGIIDYLCSRMVPRNRFFVEIGAADGLENCTAWLARARGYGGVMVDGNPILVERCRQSLENRIWNVHPVHLMVNVENVAALMKMCPYQDPDVFVLDIDGIDFHVMKQVLKLGFRPKLIVVEYNSAFGPDRAVTVPYKPRFSRWETHLNGLFYGVSIAGRRNLMNQHRYSFVTVETSGTNAFFLDEAGFPEGFAPAIQGISFLDNLGDRNGATSPYQDSSGDLVLPLRDWRVQLEQLAKLEFVEIV